MAETREERNVMVAALKREIASAESSLASLKEQIKEFEGVGSPGAETRLLKLRLTIKDHEKAIKAAGEELASRLGVPKRGPGRPPKAVMSPSEVRAADAKPEVPASPSRDTK